MTEVQALAEFVARTQLQDLSGKAREQLKIRVLDTIGVSIAALPARPIIAIRQLTAELGGRPQATLVGGGRTAPDRAAFFNGALIQRFRSSHERHVRRSRVRPELPRSGAHIIAPMARVILLTFSKRSANGSTGLSLRADHSH